MSVKVLGHPGHRNPDSTTRSSNNVGDSVFIFPPSAAQPLTGKHSCNPNLLICNCVYILHYEVILSKYSDDKGVLLHFV